MTATSPTGPVGQHSPRDPCLVELLPAAFTARRRELRDAVIGTAPDSVAAIKAAMFRYNGSARVLGVPDRPPVGSAELAVRINEAFICSQTERWSRLGSRLPDLIADAWQAAHTSTGERTPRIQAASLGLASHHRDAHPDR